MPRRGWAALLLLAASGAAGADYAHRLQQSDAEIHAARTALQAAPEPAAALALTEALITRAWLSGEAEDWASAERALAVALASPQPSPRTCVVAARLHLFLHRVEAASRSLEACAGPVGGDDEELRALHADLAFARGDLAAAFDAARERVLIGAVPSALTRLATLHEAAGHPEEAKALLLAAQRADHSGDPAQGAWLRLRRGHLALHQGRWEEARAVYLAAASMLPGWWRVEEHLAEVEALLGDAEAARARYRALLAEHAQPALMLALSELLSGDESDRLRRAARAAQKDLLRRYPEVVGGHALEVLLAAGEPASALLPAARARLQSAATGENALRFAQLAAAAGQVAEACGAVATALAGGWAAPELQWWGAHCPGGALSPERVRRRNPRAAQMYALPAALSAGLSAPAPVPP